VTLDVDPLDSNASPMLTGSVGDPTPPTSTPASRQRISRRAGCSWTARLPLVVVGGGLWASPSLQGRSPPW